MASLRPRGSDDLGLRRALSDRLLPLLVAAMVFLAALAMAGAIAAAGLAAHWRGGAAPLLTVQVPQPEGRAEAVALVLEHTPGLTTRRLDAAEVADLLRPWLGQDAARLSLNLPAVFEVRTDPVTGPQAAQFDAALERAAPGTLVERNGAWFARLVALAGSLQACAALAVVLVACVGAAVVAVAARAGLAARRDAIEIVHGLGATHGMIASRFAGRVTLLAFLGALLGVAMAVPVLLGLASLTAPFQAQTLAASAQDDPGSLFAALPPLLWELLPALPVSAALIGWVTTQITVRTWLARLP